MLFRRWCFLANADNYLFNLFLVNDFVDFYGFL